MNSKNYEKPFKSYDELISKLRKDYNIIIDNEELALNLLSTISFYDLKNGYKEYLKKVSSTQESILLETLLQFLIFDKNIQMVLLKYSIYVENFFKTKFAHFLGEHFGVDVSEYLNIDNYNKKEKGNLNKALERIKKNLNLKNADIPTKYYLEKHTHVPPWILFKNVIFYDTTMLFKFLHTDDKRKIIQEYFDINLIKSNNDEKDTEEDIELFINMINIVRTFRNKIAHNYKVITYKSEYKLFLVNYKKIDKYNLLTGLDIKNKKGTNDLLAMILSISILLNNPILNFAFFQELYFAMIADENSLKSYEEISGLPKNFYKRLEKLL